jgi:hypothetical protein
LDLKQVGSWPGFVRGPALSVAVAGDHAYVLERAQLSIFDISKPLNPQRLGGYSVPGVAVSVSGKYAYVTDQVSLVVIDISNPANPQRVGAVTKESTRGVAVSGSYAHVAELGLTNLMRTRHPPRRLESLTLAIQPIPSLSVIMIPG